MRLILRGRNCFSTLPKWATVDPWTLSSAKPHTVVNFLNGKAHTGNKLESIVDPLNGETFIHNSNTSELDAYIASQKSVPIFGLHNPIRNVARYQQMGELFLKIATEMRKP
jgi:1-pyrroline-5-carboxylate dehydrogenase